MTLFEIRIDQQNTARQEMTLKARQEARLIHKELAAREGESREYNFNIR